MEKFRNYLIVIFVPMMMFVFTILVLNGCREIFIDTGRAIIHP